MKLQKVWLLSLGIMIVSAPSAYAGGLPLVARGLGRVLFSVVEIPKSMILHSTQAFPLGLIGGTAAGAMKAVAGTVVGAADIARGAAPYAKYAIFAL